MFFRQDWSSYFRNISSYFWFLVFTAGGSFFTGGTNVNFNGEQVPLPAFALYAVLGLSLVIVVLLVRHFRSTLQISEIGINGKMGNIPYTDIRSVVVDQRSYLGRKSAEVIIEVEPNITITLTKKKSDSDTEASVVKVNDEALAQFFPSINRKSLGEYSVSDAQTIADSIRKHTSSSGQIT